MRACWLTTLSCQWKVKKGTLLVKTRNCSSSCCHLQWKIKKCEKNFVFKQSAISAFNIHFELKNKRKSKNYCTGRIWSSRRRLTATLRLHICSAMLRASRKQEGNSNTWLQHSHSCSSLPKKQNNCFAQCPSHKQSFTGLYMNQRILDCIIKAIITQTQT